MKKTETSTKSNGKYRKMAEREKRREERVKKDTGNKEDMEGENVRKDIDRNRNKGSCQKNTEKNSKCPQII